MPEEHTINECYQYNRDTRSYVEAVENRHGEKIKEIEQDIKKLIERMSNRLPVWATLFISFLCLLVGGLLAKVVFA